MKPNMRSILWILPAVLFLGACGPIVKPGISGKVKNTLALPGQAVVDLPRYAADCEAKGGALMGSGPTCVTATSTNVSGSNGSIQNTVLNQNFLAGMAIRASGSGTEGLVYLYVNNSFASNVPAGFTVIGQSGQLRLVSQPGSWTGVNIVIYTCYNEYMAQIYCPAM